MLAQAKKLNPNNRVYEWHCLSFDWHATPKPIISHEVKTYAHLVFQKDSPLRKELKRYGSLGDYFLSRMEYMANEIFDYEQKAPLNQK